MFLMKNGYRYIGGNDETYNFIRSVVDSQKNDVTRLEEIYIWLRGKTVTPYASVNELIAEFKKRSSPLFVDKVLSKSEVTKRYFILMAGFNCLSFLLNFRKWLKVYGLVESGEIGSFPELVIIRKTYVTIWNFLIDVDSGGIVSGGECRGDQAYSEELSKIFFPLLNSVHDLDTLLTEESLCLFNVCNDILMLVRLLLDLRRKSNSKKYSLLLSYDIKKLLEELKFILMTSGRVGIKPTV